MKKDLLISKIIEHLQEGLTRLNNADWATANLSYQCPPAPYVHIITNLSFHNAAGEKLMVKFSTAPEVMAPLKVLIYEANKEQQCNTFIVRAVNQGAVTLEWEYYWDQAFVDMYQEDMALSEGLNINYFKSRPDRFQSWYNDPAFEQKLPKIFP